MGVSRGARPLVLVVDDDGPILDSLGEILAEEGYAVAVARNGQEALAYLAANPNPDCILLDVMMPVMNGYDFRRAQLRDPRTATIPTLLLTAGHVDGRVAELRLSGWLRKPINLPLLLASVQQHCRPAVAAAEGVAPFANHLVHFYLQESRLLDRAAVHLGDGLQVGNPALAVCTRTHWDGLQDRLAAARYDLHALARTGMLHWTDAAKTVDHLRAGQRAGLDPERVQHFLGENLDAIAPAPGSIQVFGEVVNLLCQSGQFDEAVDLEIAWNDAGHERPLSLLCSYAAAGDEHHHDRICRQHTQVTRDLA
jgi:CheY-like chemotaxis protein